MSYTQSELLRFTTAGNVDDGKSTLIGRLLYDSKSIFEDQLEALEQASERRGEAAINLALLTDGLKAEREQGITIDVAYRYFSTPKRKFIIADTPGHVQYTRNMVTGASTANVALILVDARQGLVEQTRRHAFIATLLQIPHLVVCINKMDLVGFRQEVFQAIQEDFRAFAAQLQVKDVRFIPMSALQGDNLVDRSTKMDWYTGPTLLDYLETVPISKDHNLVDGRFPVQWVVRPNTEEHHDYRGYAGRIAGGVFRPGDPVVLLPSGRNSTIAQIDSFDGPLDEAFPPMSVTLLLTDDCDLSRGDMIVPADQLPQVDQNLQATLCWFNERPLQPSGKYLLLHTTREVRCAIKSVDFILDINTLQPDTTREIVGMNDIVQVQLRTAQPIFFDPYQRNRQTGSFILIDENTNETVAAGMIASFNP